MLKERPTTGSSAISYYRAGSAGSRLGPEHLDLALVREARILHVTGITAALAAGDAFVAGYLLELDPGAPLAERLRTAAACGAIVCTAPGEWEAAPDRKAITRLLGEGDPVQR